MIKLIRCFVEIMSLVTHAVYIRVLDARGQRGSWIPGANEVLGCPLGLSKDAKRPTRVTALGSID